MSEMKTCSHCDEKYYTKMRMDTNLLDKINAIINIFLPIIFYSVVRFLDINDIGNICLWKNLTGHECIGCGTMRALYALLNSDFKLAYEHNHLIIIIAPLLLYLWLKSCVKAIDKAIVADEAQDNE